MAAEAISTHAFGLVHWRINNMKRFLRRYWLRLNGVKLHDNRDLIALLKKATKVASSSHE